MGQDVPDDWVETDPILWHCVSLELWGSDFPGTGCDLFTPTYASFCVLGQVIIDWISSDGQCSGVGLVDIPFLRNQRILRIAKGFDTEAECNAAGCPLP